MRSMSGNKIGVRRTSESDNPSGIKGGVYCRFQSMQAIRPVEELIAERIVRLLELSRNNPSKMMSYFVTVP